MMLGIERNGKKKTGVRKTAAAGPARMKKAVKPAAFAAVDFPLNGEVLQPNHYTVRISAAGDGPVEILIDGSDWKPCRESVGFHWFDWFDISRGAHQIVARVRASDGKYKKSKVTKCAVK